MQIHLLLYRNSLDLYVNRDMIIFFNNLVLILTIIFIIGRYLNVIGFSIFLYVIDNLTYSLKMHNYLSMTLF